MRAQQDYNVGIYCRLSVDDGTNSESMSIGNQRSMLEEYVKKQGWNIEDTYIDDGWSGTGFDRPDFKRMIDDIERNRINLVIVKDLSRLGRNYILCGQYTEIFFPSRNVRFIALNEVTALLGTTRNIEQRDITVIRIVSDFSYYCDNIFLISAFCMTFESSIKLWSVSSIEVRFSIMPSLMIDLISLLASFLFVEPSNEGFSNLTLNTKFSPPMTSFCLI